MGHIIGISCRDPHGRGVIAKLVAVELKTICLDFDDTIIETLNAITGADFESAQDKKLDLYLDDKWSYIREEKFVDGDKLLFKPVKYYLTGRQIFKKLKYGFRDIHNNIWVNMFMAEHGDKDFVSPVQYPNQADSIKNQRGLVIRVNSKSSNAKAEDTIMDDYPFDYTFDLAKMKSLNELSCQIAKKLKEGTTP